jgi:hypothetical protein
VFKLQLIPRDMHFFDLFESAADNMVLAADRLVDLLDNFEEVEAKAQAIKAIEHESDGITHEIMNELRRTFIPPLDGDDIVALAEALDDVVDYIEDAAARMVLYRVDRPTETARDLARIIQQIAQELQRTLPVLRDKNNSQRILDSTVEINRLENLADDAARRGLNELFDHPDPANVLHVVKWRELYEVLEGATDRGEDVADVLEGVVRKR